MTGPVRVGIWEYLDFVAPPRWGATKNGDAAFWCPDCEDFFSRTPCPECGREGLTTEGPSYFDQEE